MKLFLDSFNAKHLKSEEIASTFVSSQLFKDTAQDGHTILIGPRGSGKTTFLRMLSNDTWPKWYSKQSGMVSNVNYEGVYVPGDIVWGEMMNALLDAGVSKECSNEFSYAAFCTHVFISTIESIEYSIQQHANSSSISSIDKLHDSFQAISKILMLNMDKVSLHRIRLELNQRLNELGQFLRDCVFNSDLSIALLRKRLPYSLIDLTLALESIFSSIDSALDRTEHRWAILLDEFEIAPEYLLDKVISNMRSAAKKLMFKVALVPCGPHQKIKSQTSSIHDFSIVELWYRNAKDCTGFCRSLLINRFGVVDPVKVFGRTKFSGTKPTQVKDEWKRNFDELKVKDQTFKTFLISSKINIEEQLLLEGPSNSTIRKIAPLVAFRNAFLNNSGKRKGRKALPEFYSGWEALTRITEGNPRWLLASVNSLFNEFGIEHVDQKSQFSQTSAVSTAYAAMLRTTALSNNMGISTRTSPFTLLQKIANYFNERLIDYPFSSSVPGTFVVDDKTSDDEHNALMIAWNHGAIVLIDKNKPFGTYSNLVGMRFRISFLLAPIFDLLLRVDPSISLSAVLKSPSHSNQLKHKKNIELDVKSADNYQRGLFDDQ